jgi:hypothetical protein
MTDFLPETVQFSIPFIFVLLISTLAIILSYLVYRQTNPNNSSFLRTFLATLRTILLLSLLILFFKPKLFIQFFEKKHLNVALLVDYSASMNWQDENEKRIDSLNIALEKIKKITSDYDVNLNASYFNQTVIQGSDSLNTPYGTTNFKNAFDNLKSTDNQMAILVSDGIRTDGVVPQSIGIPVYAVGIGKKSTLADVFINDVEYDPVAYQDKEQNIVVKISAHNIAASQAKVFLYQGNSLLSSKNIVIEQNGVEQDVSFTFKINQAGLKQFKIEIKPETEDSNKQNNTFVFTQDILKNKIRIGIFSSVPNNEYKFLKFLLSQSENVEVIPYLKIANRGVGNYDVDSLDVVMLQGYPGRFTAQSELSKISQSIQRSGQGLIIFLDENTNLSKLSSFDLKNVFSQIKKRERVISVSVKPAEANNLLLRLYDDPELTSLFFNSVPPIESDFEIQNKISSSDVLIAAASGEISDKNMIISETKDQKIIIMNGSGFWRWHFSLQRDDKIKNGYFNLLSNMIRWAANKNKFQPVVLNVNKNTVNPGQEIMLDGRLFDSQNNPITNGRMEINVQSGNQEFSIPMEADSSGVFNARYTPVNEGAYLFTAQGLVDGEVIGTDKKSIVVVPYNREFIRTNQDSSFLKLLADNSAGKYFTLVNLDSIRNYMGNSDARILVKDEIELRFKSWLLYFLILVVVTEWVFRKKNNLP